MKLSVVIVSFNTQELLRKCLGSIKKHAGNLKIEIIVVDNGSTDGSKEYLKTQNSKPKTTTQNLKLIFNNQNLGFAKANNQGIKEAQGEHILLLNSDTEVKTGTLGNLIDFAENYPEAGIVGARLLNSDGSIQPSVYHFPTIWRAIAEYWLGQKGAYEKYMPVVTGTVTGTDPVRVEAVTGAAMLIPRKTIEKIGLLDERYFMYFEDLDYCRRAQKAGLKVYYLPQAEVIHHHGASGQEMPEKTRRWLIASSKIYHGKLKYWLITCIIWLGQKWQKTLRF